MVGRARERQWPGDDDEKKPDGHGWRTNRHDGCQRNRSTASELRNLSFAVRKRLHANVHVHEVTPEGPGRIVAVNEAACHLLGYTQAEFLSMDVSAIDVPEQAERRPAIMRDLYSAGHAQFLTEHLSKGGGRIPVAVTNSVIALNGTAAVLSIASDLSERRQVDEVRMRYRWLAESTRDIIVFSRASDGLILEANAAAEATYDYSREELRQLNGGSQSLLHVVTGRRSDSPRAGSGPGGRYAHS
ncbi:MAG: PAS domain-containing protein [Thermoleophilia bacterium]